jgi:hypothetical protein
VTATRPGLAALLACLLAATPAHANAVEAVAEAEIAYLLQRVADSGCLFSRNGATHDAADAADHLRLKYRRGRRYADTAEHFIDRLASGSSWSGEPYSIECADYSGPSGPWLHRALREYRDSPAQ